MHWSWKHQLHCSLCHLHLKSLKSLKVFSLQRTCKTHIHVVILPVIGKHLNVSISELWCIISQVMLPHSCKRTYSLVTTAFGLKVSPALWISCVETCKNNFSAL